MFCKKEFFFNDITVGKRTYFMGYGILQHPVVAVFVYKMLHTVVHVLELQNLTVVKYGINLVIYSNEKLFNVAPNIAIT